MTLNRDQAGPERRWDNSGNTGVEGDRLDNDELLHTPTDVPQQEGVDIGPPPDTMTTDIGPGIDLNDPDSGGIGPDVGTIETTPGNNVF